MLAALAFQLTSGVAMVINGFPLWLATAHNAGAALSPLAVLGLIFAPRPACARRGEDRGSRVDEDFRQCSPPRTVNQRRRWTKSEIK